MLSGPGERRAQIRSGRGETRTFPRMNSYSTLVTKMRHWNSVQKWWSLALKAFLLINDMNQFPESFSLPSKGIKNIASTIAAIHCYE